MTTLKSRTKNVSLSFMGDAWSEAYIEMRYLTWADSKALSQESPKGEDEAIEETIKTIQHVFVSGKTLDAEGKLVEITKDDIEQFDFQALQRLYGAALGLPDPKE